LEKTTLELKFIKAKLKSQNANEIEGNLLLIEQKKFQFFFTNSMKIILIIQQNFYVQFSKELIGKPEFAFCQKKPNEILGLSKLMPKAKMLRRF
jgi:hypothetical protein